MKRTIEWMALPIVSALLLLSGNVASAQKKTNNSSPPPPPPRQSAPVQHSAPAQPHTASPMGNAPRATGGMPNAHGPNMGGNPAAAHGPSLGGNPAAAHGPTFGGNPAATHGPTMNPNPAYHGGPNTSLPHNTTGLGNNRTAPSAGYSSPASGRTFTAPNGAQMHMRANNQPREVHFADRGLNVHHGLDGHRRVEVERPDHTRIVAEHGNRGFVEHPYSYRGHEFGRRTYYHGGRVYDRFYGSHYYHGVYVHYYAPAYYYRPAFYGWVYNPWAVPVVYPWGWAGNPWYGYYGYYFTPYPAYPSAAAWLTDYMISTTLASAYQNALESQALAQGTPQDAAPLTPEVKAQISEEVRRQIALENLEAQNAQNGLPDPASSSIQRTLTDGLQHVFLVGHEIDVINASGNECAVSQGDALQLVGPPPANSPTATLMVLSTKGGIECRRNDMISVQIVDLQEMQNQMRETIGAGLGEIQSKQGNALPAMPVSARGEPIRANFMTDAPPPDANVATELSQQYAAGVSAENQVLASAGAPQDGRTIPSYGTSTPGVAPIAPPAPPPTQINIGQSLDEVTAALGQPVRIVDLNTKLIYVYKDLKITFKAGKVFDVQ